MAFSLRVRRAWLAFLSCVAPGCAGDAVVDLTVQAWDDRAIDVVDVVVCSARNRTEVLDAVTLQADTPLTVTLRADGSAVAFSATTVDGLCGATCQVELEPEASVETALVLHPCVPCPTLAVTAANVCQNPLCFMTPPELSACDD